MLLYFIRGNGVLKVVLDLRSIYLVSSRRDSELFFNDFKEVILTEMLRQHVPDALWSVHLLLMLASRVKLSKLSILVSLQVFNLVHALDQRVCLHFGELDSILVHVFHQGDILPQALRVMRDKLNLANEVRLDRIELLVEDLYYVWLETISHIEQLALDLRFQRVRLLWIGHGEVLGEHGSVHLLLVVFGNHRDVTFLRTLKLLLQIFELLARL